MGGRFARRQHDPERTLHMPNKFHATLKGGNESKITCEFAGRCGQDATHALITEAEGIPLIPTIAKAVRMGRALLNSFLKIAKRSISWTSVH